MERQALQIFWFNIFNVFLILMTKNNIGDTGAFGSQNLFFDATHGQHFATQCDFARHCQIFAHFALGERRHQRCYHRYTGRWSVFRNSAFGHVDMHIVSVENVSVNVPHIGMCFDILHRNHRRFLHHIAQIAGKCQFVARFSGRGERRFYKQNLTTHSSPCQACHHTGIVVALIFVGYKFLWSQEIFHHIGSNRFRVRQLRHLFASDFAKYFTNFLFQIAHTAFTSVVFDNFCQSGFCNRNFFRFQPIFLQLLGQEMTRRNFHLFFLRVAVDFNNLHSIEQRLRNGLQRIGSGDEEHFRQIVVNVDIIVVEM